MNSVAKGAAALCAIGMCVVAGSCAPRLSEEALETLGAQQRAKYNLEKDQLDCTGRSKAETGPAYSGPDRFAGMLRVPSKDAEAYLTDRTVVSYDFGRHGTQIEYTAADGTAHLWYPGNNRIVHGRWKVDRSGKYTKVCFAYGPKTYNPQTGHVGPGFECGQFNHSQMFDMDTAQGDVFGLAAAQGAVKPLPKSAAKPYVPTCVPFIKPYKTNGKSPIEHLREDLGRVSS